MGILTSLIQRLMLSRTRQLRPRAVLGLGALLICCLSVAAHAEPATNEYSVKAAFILNFARFVDWPESAFKHKGEFCIGSLGRSPLDRELAALKGRSVKGRTVVFRQFNSPEEAADCQVLYITRAEPARIVKALEVLKDTPVLTVSDQEAFCTFGGALTLAKENGRIVFDVNIEAKAPPTKLTPSSQLLKLARKIYGWR